MIPGSHRFSVRNTALFCFPQWLFPHLVSPLFYFLPYQSLACDLYVADENLAPEPTVRLLYSFPNASDHKSCNLESQQS